ncbi:MAG: hypothetical protein KC649_07115, partial [Candidatus Omnitrophica bacterium]|nr:hypothetical protein [Candidatus Omnitrophota bacterium]
EIKGAKTILARGVKLKQYTDSSEDGARLAERPNTRERRDALESKLQETPPNGGHEGKWTAPFLAQALNQKEITIRHDLEARGVYSSNRLHIFRKGDPRPATLRGDVYRASEIPDDVIDNASLLEFMDQFMPANEAEILRYDITSEEDNSIIAAIFNITEEQLIKIRTRFWDGYTDYLKTNGARLAEHPYDITAEMDLKKRALIEELSRLKRQLTESFRGLLNELPKKRSRPGTFYTPSSIEVIRSVFESERKDLADIRGEIFQTGIQYRMLLNQLIMLNNDFDSYRDLNLMMSNQECVMCAPMAEAIQDAGISIGFSVPIRSIHLPNQGDVSLEMLLGSDAINVSVEPKRIFHQYAEIGDVGIDPAFGMFDPQWLNRILVTDSAQHLDSVERLQQAYEQIPFEGVLDRVVDGLAAEFFNQQRALFESLKSNGARLAENQETGLDQSLLNEAADLAQQLRQDYQAFNKVTNVAHFTSANYFANHI